NPDPDGKVHRDADNLIQSEVTVVPGQVRPGKSARVHLVLRPNPKKQIHWNTGRHALSLVWAARLYRITSPNTLLIHFFTETEEKSKIESERQASEVVEPAWTGGRAYEILLEIEGTILHGRRPAGVGYQARANLSSDAEGLSRKQ